LQQVVESPLLRKNAVEAMSLEVDLRVRKEGGKYGRREGRERGREREGGGGSTEGSK
tara:strand:+ start:114 stop:284 length:171 start_codon:yes stop_codon:yes gene_type:complete